MQPLAESQCAAMRTWQSTCNHLQGLSVLPYALGNPLNSARLSVVMASAGILQRFKAAAMVLLGYALVLFTYEVCDVN